MKYLVYGSEYFRVEDAVMISRHVPNLMSLTMFPPVRQQGDDLSIYLEKSAVYFENFGREILFVKELILCFTTAMSHKFMEKFTSNRSLFPQVTSLRFVERDCERDFGPLDCEAFDMSNRTRCTMSSLHFLSATKNKLCDVCYEARASNWMCPRCQCFVFEVLG